jgi:SH3-like domain-containing protein
VASVVPIKLQTSGKSNIRDGPGTNYRILYTLESGTDVTGYSYLETWVKVSDAKGRSGWVARGLVGRGKDN